jgi:hypothetical protein
MGNQFADQLLTLPVLQSRVSAADSESGSAPVFWVYLDDSGRWRLREEGGAAEAAFGSRAAAADFVKDLADKSPYRLFIETQDGRIVQELHGITPSPRSGNAEDRIANSPAAAKAGAMDDGHESRTSGLREQLAWANQLASAARVSPSRMSLLGAWLRKIRSSASTARA